MGVDPNISVNSVRPLFRVLWEQSTIYKSMSDVLCSKQGKIMGKEQKSNKETKKVAAMTPKEKKAAKKAKKNERGRIGQ